MVYYRLHSDSAAFLPCIISGFRSPPPFRWTGGQWEIVGTDSQVIFVVTCIRSQQIYLTVAVQVLVITLHQGQVRYHC